jgi:geranylgeranyl reductase family protein
MGENEFQLLIVGAGPAGSLAAARLARGGVRVALFDGRPPEKAKPCGGGVTSKALKAWPELLRAVGRRVDDLELYSPSGRRLKLELNEPFAIYSRRALDDFLRDEARNAGAKVVSEKVSWRPRNESETLWTLRGADGARYQAPFLVGADGANSLIAKKLAGPLPNAEMEVAFGYRAPLSDADNAPTVVAFLPGYAGYAWAFPRLDHISFGIATPQDAFDHAALDALLWDFMQGYYRQRADKNAPLWGVKDEKLKAELNATAERYAARIPGLAPETFDTRRACGPGWALLGDAAGFADPVTGEGIYYALRSAELFAEAYLSGAPETYEQKWRGDFGRELRRASQMRRRFYGQMWGGPFTERMVQFSRFHPGIQKVLADLVAGEQGYVTLKKQLVRHAVWPF